MARHEGRAGYLGMLTFTSPSPDEHLAWVVDWDRRTERPRCGCHKRLEGGLGLWNASASSRWNHLRTLLAREYPGQEFLKAVEVQERGALHLHVIHWSPEPIDLTVVQALAVRAGFGCVLDYAPCAPGSRRAAYYVAKYVTKACDQRGAVPWDVVNTWTGEVEAVEQARYRTWSSSRGWGMTMRMLRDAIRAAAERRAAAARGEQPAIVAGQVEAPAPSGDPPL
jgi:hypothetical protein